METIITGRHSDNGSICGRGIELGAAGPRQGGCSSEKGSTFHDFCYHRGLFKPLLSRSSIPPFGPKLFRISTTRTAVLAESILTGCWPGGLRCTLVCARIDQPFSQSLCGGHCGVSGTQAGVASSNWLSVNWWTSDPSARIT